MGDVITLSFLGYEKQEVRIDSRLDRKNAQFKLKPSTNTLEETVVVGLGSQRKVSVVGAITNVDVKDLQTPATSIPNMLGGRVPVLFPCKTVVNREKTSLNSGYVVSELSVPTKVHWY